MTKMSAVDYGYGDAAPDTTDYGYGDAAPDSAADYGYGDAAPDSAAADDQQQNGDAAANDADKYGYGDAAAPNDADKYGYGDASPNDAADKYGYGDASPNDAADKYGYGDSNPDDAAKLGYGNDHHEYEIGMCLFLLYLYRFLLYDYDPTKSDRTNPDCYYCCCHCCGCGCCLHDVTGLNDDSSASDKLQPRSRNTPNRTYSADAATVGARGGRGRYRRRGSVTKFSLSTADTVKKEYGEHEDLINKFRSEAQVSNLSRTSTHSNSADSVELSDSGESTDNLLDENAKAAKKKMKKNSKRFMKFGGRRGSK
jgi:hypothetical protein